MTVSIAYRIVPELRNILLVANRSYEISMPPKRANGIIVAIREANNTKTIFPVHRSESGMRNIVSRNGEEMTAMAMIINPTATWHQKKVAVIRFIRSGSPLPRASAMNFTTELDMPKSNSDKKADRAPEQRPKTERLDAHHPRGVGREKHERDNQNRLSQIICQRRSKDSTRSLHQVSAVFCLG